MNLYCFSSVISMVFLVVDKGGATPPRAPGFAPKPRPAASTTAKNCPNFSCKRGESVKFIENCGVIETNPDHENNRCEYIIQRVPGVCGVELELLSDLTNTCGNEAGNIGTLMFTNGMQNRKNQLNKFDICNRRGFGRRKGKRVSKRFHNSHPIKVVQTGNFYMKLKISYLCCTVFKQRNYGDICCKGLAGGTTVAPMITTHQVTLSSSSSTTNPTTTAPKTTTHTTTTKPTTVIPSTTKPTTTPRTTTTPTTTTPSTTPTTTLIPTTTPGGTTVAPMITTHQVTLSSSSSSTTPSTTAPKTTTHTTMPSTTTRTTPAPTTTAPSTTPTTTLIPTKVSPPPTTTPGRRRHDCELGKLIEIRNCSTIYGSKEDGIDWCIYFIYEPRGQTCEVRVTVLTPADCEGYETDGEGIELYHTRDDDEFQFCGLSKGAQVIASFLTGWPMRLHITGPYSYHMKIAICCGNSEPCCGNDSSSLLKGSAYQGLKNLGSNPRTFRKLIKQD